MKINSQFDSGNIRVVSCEDIENIVLEIEKDTHSDFFQWFHFKLHTNTFETHTISIQGLEQSAYPEGWTDYQALASYDHDTWFRVESSYHKGVLTINFTPEHESVYFAYFAPYSYERHLQLVGLCQTHFLCQHHLLGLTHDGREINLLHVQDQQSDLPKHKIWITARQHPGETMAQWLVEGLLTRLLDEHDGIANALLQTCEFFIVPNMNPDGSVRGNLRTNALGINLNREWQNPSIESSPEVYYVLEKMNQTGVDCFIDVHGDEALPYVFVAGCEGNPNYSDKISDLENTFKRSLLDVSAEFQDQFGYPKDEPGDANLNIASNAVGHRFDCLAYTLEMPFKDNANLPDQAYGWSPERSKQLGKDMLVSILAVSKQI